MVAVAEDIPRLRDGLGIPVPPGIAATFTEQAAHPIEDLVLRWARTHGPFVAAAIASRYSLGPAVVEATCAALAGSGTLVAGSFVDLPTQVGADGSPDVPARLPRQQQYCHSQVLSLIKRRSLALLRKGVEPVEQQAYARFLPEWQGSAPEAGVPTPCWV